MSGRCKHDCRMSPTALRILIPRAVLSARKKLRTSRYDPPWLDILCICHTAIWVDQKPAIPPTDRTVLPIPTICNLLISLPIGPE